MSSAADELTVTKLHLNALTELLSEPQSALAGGCLATVFTREFRR